VNFLKKKISERGWGSVNQFFNHKRENEHIPAPEKLDKNNGKEFTGRLS
jgi:hypothetical protein